MNLFKGVDTLMNKEELAGADEQAFGLQAGLQPMFYKYSHGVNFWDQMEQDCTSRHLDLICCRGESAALQLVAGALSPFLLTVSGDALFWKGGPLPVVRVSVDWDGPCGIGPELRLIGLMADDDGRRKADLLLDESYVHVEPRRLQQVWIELPVAAEAPPGMYKGRITLCSRTVFEDERKVAELTFTLKVLSRTLPPAASNRFYLDLWQHNANLARKYEVELWSEAHFAVMDTYLCSLGQLGQKAATVIVSEIPWSGQSSHIDAEPSDLFEYSMIGLRRGRDGVFRDDYTVMDRYIAMASRHGIDAEIELFGLLGIWQTPDGVYGPVASDYPDGIRLRYYDEASGTYRFVRDRAGIERYILRLAEHLRERGWMEKVRIMADEPSDLSLFHARLEALRDLVPDFRYKIAINHAEFLQHPVEGMYDCVPKLDCALRDWSALQAARPSLPGRLLYYVCNSPARPNTFLRSPAIESRTIPWLVERLGLDGFLRWNYTVWPDRPLERIAYRPSHWPAGETNFVYPGKLGRPLLSLRYKWLQRGIRDFELLQQLKAEGRADAVRRLLEGVFRFETEGNAVSADLQDDAGSLYSLAAEDYDKLYDVLELIEEEV
ncbi:DUF4091 domain-containing protein [Paenibacillus sp. 1P07SE]|uniref:DUF4091 domain-containing protein n=1 Tax=Paenibacillus sp. 1P07SE TaxID=3132209 RepID=UPI0039A752F8